MTGACTDSKATKENGGLTTAHLLLVVAAVLIANLNVLSADFVWDDRLLIIGNDSIKRLDSLPSLFTQPFLRVYYRPIVMLTFALEHAVYGLKPWGFHLTNLLLHCANAVLVYIALGRISRSRHVALAAALLFAVHPAHKVVVMINDRTGLLATLFFLSSLILYMRHRQSTSAGRAWFSYGASCALFALGLFSKEEALTLPLIIILADIMILDDGERFPYFKRAIRYLPYFALIGFYFGVRGLVVGSGGGMAAAFMVEPVHRLMTVPSILVDYLLVLLVPYRINYDPRIPLASSIFEPGIIVPILLLAALGALLPLLVSRSKRVAFGLLWFFIAFIPMCNIIPIYPDVADVELTTPVRYLYLPSIGIFLLAGLAFERLVAVPETGRNGVRKRNAAIPAFCCIVLVFSFLSIKRNTLWKDEVFFYRYVIDLQPENHKMHFNLGTVYLQRGKLDAAMEELTRAATLAPDRVEYRNNLALAYKAKGWLERAVEEFGQALRLDPESAMAHANLAATYTAQKQIPEAIAAGERAVGLAPSSFTARVNLAEAYAAAGRLSEAEEHFLEAVRLRPDSAAARESLKKLEGMAY